jgi:hypothetical protein
MRAIAVPEIKIAAGIPPVEYLEFPMPTLNING